MSCSREKRYQALPVFRTASDKKLGGAGEGDQGTVVLGLLAKSNPECKP